MLVLSRKIGEGVRIEDDMYVTVLGVECENGIYRIRIGFDAPKCITIHREEAYRKLVNANNLKSKLLAEKVH